MWRPRSVPQATLRGDGVTWTRSETMPCPPDLPGYGWIPYSLFASTEGSLSHRHQWFPVWPSRPAASPGNLLQAHRSYFRPTDEKLLAESSPLCSLSRWLRSSLRPLPFYLPTNNRLSKGYVHYKYIFDMFVYTQNIPKRIHQELFSNSYLWDVRPDVGHRETYFWFFLVHTI